MRKPRVFGTVPIDNEQCGVVVKCPHGQAFFLSSADADQFAFEIIKSSKSSQLMSVLAATLIRRGATREQIKKALREFADIIKSEAAKK